MFQQNHYINHLIQNGKRNQESNRPHFFRGKIAADAILHDHGTTLMSNSGYVVEVIDTMNPDGSPFYIGGCHLLAENAAPEGFGDRTPLVKGTPVFCVSMRGDYKDCYILGSFKAWGDYTKILQQGVSTLPGEPQQGKYVNTSTYSIYPPLVALPNAKTDLIPKYKSEYDTKESYSELAQAYPELGGLKLTNNYNGDILQYTVGKQLFYADEDILLLSGVAGKSKCDTFKDLSVFYCQYADALESTFKKEGNSSTTPVDNKAESEAKEDPLFQDKPTAPSTTKQASSSATVTSTNSKSATETSLQVGATSDTFLRRFDREGVDYREWATIDYHISELRLLSKQYAEEGLNCELNQAAQVLANAIDRPSADDCKTTKDSEAKTSNPVTQELISKYSLTNLGVYKLEDNSLKLVYGYQYSSQIKSTASTIKLLIALAVIDKNPNLNTELVIDSSITLSESIGYKNTVRGCLTRMLKESTNDDANMLVKYVLGGETSFNSWLKSNNYSQSSFSYFRANPPAGSPTKNSSCSDLSKALFNISKGVNNPTKIVCIEALKANNYIAGYNHRLANKADFISSKIADTTHINKDGVDYFICIYLDLQGSGWDSPRVTKLKEAINLITNNLGIVPTSSKVCENAPEQVNLELSSSANLRPRGSVSFTSEPASASNMKKGRTSKIDKIILHNTGTSLANKVAIFKQPSSQVSAHYTVARSGTVYQHVKDEDIAWHANSSSNNTSIGIEIESTLEQPYMGNIQEIALKSLISEKMRQYSIPKANILPHRDVYSNTECPNLIWLFSNTPSQLKNNHPHGEFRAWINKNF